MKIDRYCCWIVAVVVLLLCFCPCALASEEQGISPGDVIGSDNFILLTPEQFEQAKTVFEYGTDEQRKAAVNQALQGTAGTYAWTQTLIENLGGGTYRMQGYVTFSHTVNDMTVNCYLLAQMTGSNAYGYTWTYYSEEGTALPASGNYTFTGRCESLLLSPFKLSLNTVGSFEITHSNALSIGINLEIVSAAYSVGMTTYYRQDVTVTHVETLSHKS